MKIDDEVLAAGHAGPQARYPWSQPLPREDRVAETLAVIALVFAVGTGLVIALLPVAVKATSVDLVRPAAVRPAAALSAPAR